MNEKTDAFPKEDLIEDGKNKTLVKCARCPSKILNKGLATYKEIKFKLPFLTHKAEGDPYEGEELSDYWQVGDMYTFENIGFSKTVDDLKYLICADCEMGPIGWHDLPSKQSYVALSRVSHEK